MSKIKQDEFTIDDSIIDSFSTFKNFRKNNKPYSISGYGFFREESLVARDDDSYYEDEDDRFQSHSHLSNCWSENGYNSEVLICLALAIPLEECISYAYLCNKMFEKHYNDSVIKYVKGSSSKYGARVFYVNTNHLNNDHYSPMLRLTTAFRSIADHGNNYQCYEAFQLLADNLRDKFNLGDWRDYKSLLLPENKDYVKSLSHMLILSRMLEVNENKSLMESELTIPTFKMDSPDDMVGAECISGFLRGGHYIPDLLRKISVSLYPGSVTINHNTVNIISNVGFNKFSEYHFSRIGAGIVYLSIPHFYLTNLKKLMGEILNNNVLDYLPKKLGVAPGSAQIKNAVLESAQNHALSNRRKYLLAFHKVRDQIPYLCGYINEKEYRNVTILFNGEKVTNEILKDTSISIINR